MKYLRRLAFLALIAGYFLWPYHATKKFSQAVEAKDSETVASMIDADAFLESIKDLSVEAAMIKMEERMPAGGRVDKDAMRQQIRTMVDSPAFAAQMGKQFNAEALTRAMFAGEAQAKSMGMTSPGWRNERWVNPVTFSAQDPHSEARAIFKFRGLGWKLAGIEVPAKELRRFMPIMMGSR
jgi:hypothetical protein